MNNLLIAVCMACLTTAAAYAGEVKVAWQEPEHFTDIRPSHESRGGFQERVIKEFDQMFANLASRLPDGYRWNVTVTDLDLAGDIRPWFGRTLEEIRLVKDPYWPRMAFTYELLDSQGKTVASGKEDIADMNFLMHASTTTGRSSFPYEEHMLEDWFYAQQKEKAFPTR